MEQEAQLNYGRQDGKTALAVAAKEGHDEVMSFLLGQCDIDVERVDNEGNTPSRQATHPRTMPVARDPGKPLTDVGDKAEDDSGDHASK